MALEDFVEPEVGIAVAATALVASPRARNALRGAVVYGLAGAFKLGDAIASGARGLADGADRAPSSAGDTVGPIDRRGNKRAQSPDHV